MSKSTYILIKPIIMETAALLSNKILHKLADSYWRFSTLAELTDNVSSYLNTLQPFLGNISFKINEAKILEALIQLDNDGYIYLNPNNDESSITIKGLIKIDNKILYN